MQAIAKPPLTQKINFRLITFLAVIGLPIGWIVYQFVHAQVTHGVTQVGDYKLVDLKSLGNFPFDETASTVNDIPPMWRELNNKKVMLEGFMFAPTSAGNDLNRFEFVYNIQKCCFGGPPKVQERVFTVVPHGGTVPYYGEMVRCSGILHVGVHKNDVGAADRVFIMELEKVEPL